MPHAAPASQATQGSGGWLGGGGPRGGAGGEGGAMGGVGGEGGAVGGEGGTGGTGGDVGGEGGTKLHFRRRYTSRNVPPDKPKQHERFGLKVPCSYQVNATA